MPWDQLVTGCIERITNPDGTVSEIATLSCIPAVIANIISALFLFVGVVCLVLIIGSGYRYMNAGGDPKKLEGARNTLIHAILGLLIVLFSYFIIGLISQITNIPCIKLISLNC